MCPMMMDAGAKASIVVVGSTFPYKPMKDRYGQKDASDDNS